MDKKIRFNSKMIFLVLLTIIIIPIAFAGWIDFLKGGMTGWVPATNYTARVVIGTGANSPPNITFVSNYSITSLNSGTSTSIAFSFIAYDIDGVSDLNDASATANFTLAGENTRYNLSCRNVSDVNVTGGNDLRSANYSCDVVMWFYDRPGAWLINVTINDTAGLKGYNATTYTNIPALISINMTPSSLNWTNLPQGSANQNATSSINITNDGNQILTNLTIKAYELLGQGGAAGNTITAGSFTAGNNTATKCQQQALVNNTAQNVTAMMTVYGKGTYSQPIYYCIPTVPEITSGTYNTTNVWITSTSGNT